MLGRRRRGPQINQPHLGQNGAADALGQMQGGIAATFAIDHGLQRRRRRGQNDGKPRQVAAHHGHVAGAVGHAVLLLVGAVVFLVDDDQAELGIRQKQRRTGADHHRNAAFGDRPPRPPPPCVAQFRMPQRRFAAEAPGEALQPLGRQRDLGQQNQRLAARPEGLGDGLEIHLGLARAGDPVEHGNREFPAFHRLAQSVGRRRLIGGQIGPLARGIGRREG